MSVSLTKDSLIVALDFEGKLAYVIPYVFKIRLNSTRNRRPQSRTFSSGGHASRSFQHRYIESRE